MYGLPNGMTANDHQWRECHFCWFKPL